jgi:hypothetical protein
MYINVMFIHEIVIIIIILASDLVDDIGPDLELQIEFHSSCEKWRVLCPTQIIG